MTNCLFPQLDLLTTDGGATQRGHAVRHIPNDFLIKNYRVSSRVQLELFFTVHNCWPLIKLMEIFIFSDQVKTPSARFVGPGNWQRAVGEPT